MVRQAAACGCDIKFDAEALARANIRIEPCNTEGELDPLDRIDATSKIYDKLKIKPLWWILEIFPMSYMWQDKNGVWHKTWKCVYLFVCQCIALAHRHGRWHLGKGRKIDEAVQPKFHESARIRQAEMDYKPKARWEEGSEIYVR